MQIFSSKLKIWAVAGERGVVWPNIFCTFGNQVKRLLVLSYVQFEAVRHKTYCKGPFLKHLAKVGRSLLKRSLSQRQCEQLTKEMIVCLANL